MTPTGVRNTPASVRQRLLNQARSRNVDFQLVLTNYGLERLLYRLSRSPHRDRFFLKGALLFSVWTGAPHRATWDLDLHGRGDPSPEALEQIFRDVCTTGVEDDGLTFLPDTVRAEAIREGQEYESTRVSFAAKLSTARMHMQVDIGFGDAVTPAPQLAEFPTLLPLPAPRLWVCPRETVVAEKFEAMVVLGVGNSRMKDFFDIWFLAQRFGFRGPTLCEALRATFERRGTPLPAGVPIGLAEAFSESPDKQRQWESFLHRAALQSDITSLSRVTGLLRGFLLTPVGALVGGQAFDRVWPPGGPWMSESSEGTRDGSRLCDERSD